MTSEVKQQQLERRRAQVLEVASEGYTQREIAHKLQVDLAEKPAAHSCRTRFSS
jgi:DNA-binding NarL/FixJ family response regulator